MGKEKGLGVKFQHISPEEGRGVQRPKQRQYDNKDEGLIKDQIKNIEKFTKL